MSQLATSHLATQLKAQNVSVEDWRMIHRILLSRGFLSKSEPSHKYLYSAASRVEDILRESLSQTIGVGIENDTKTEHIRLLPYTGRDPALFDPDDDLESRRELKPQSWKPFSMALIALRLLYDDSIMARNNLDQFGRVTIRYAEFVEYLSRSFGESMPPTAFDRRAIFKKLKKHGAAETKADDLQDDTVIVIRPEITTLVVETRARAALTAAQEEIKARQGSDAGPADTPDPAEGADGVPETVEAPEAAAPAEAAAAADDEESAPEGVELADEDEDLSMVPSFLRRMASIPRPDED